MTRESPGRHETGRRDTACHGIDSRGIDRRDLVRRHTVEVHGDAAASPLSVGNGEFCFTADATGLQTFPDRYPVPARYGGPAGTLLGTQAQWAWHDTPTRERVDLADTRRSYATPRGPVEYVDLAGELTETTEPVQSAAESWLRNNPHRLDLGRIGFAAPDTITGARQRLDMYSGILHSRFRVSGAPARVTTCCHPRVDAIAARVESEAALPVRIAFPYGSESWGSAADWTSPDAHSSTVHIAEHGCTVERILDGTAYTVLIGLSPGATIRQAGQHELIIEPGAAVVEFVVAFFPGRPRPGRSLPSFACTLAASTAAWGRFWTTGGAVELADSGDRRAPELERRIVLSQYLTAIQCAGSLPPQETGLTLNSWRGRFHLEMAWWHGAHFPLWGRAELLERSLGWYTTLLPMARETAQLQGCRGARWPKNVGPDGRESPSPIGPFLIWQQPHPIALAELVRRATGTVQTVHRYADVVLQSAEFMADFAVRTARGYQLGPPLVPAQESYAARRAVITNPTFELAYWAWGLTVAQRWRGLLGLAPQPRWARVAADLVRPHIRDGVYAAIDVPPYTLTRDHPSMLYALGVVPPTGLIDPDVMRATLHHVLSTWDWETTWGWDYPAIAMTAARLGEPALAVDALLLATPKNGYLPNGHNPQSASLPVYLPANGGLLAAVALMAGGWDGDGDCSAPGFPSDGRWRVRHEGLLRSP